MVILDLSGQLPSAALLYPLCWPNTLIAHCAFKRVHWSQDWTFFLKATELPNRSYGILYPPALLEGK